MMPKINPTFNASNQDKLKNKPEAKLLQQPSMDGKNTHINDFVLTIRNKELDTLAADKNSPDLGMGKNIAIAFLSAIGLIGIAIVGSLVVKKRILHEPLKIVSKGIESLWKKMFDNITQKQKFHRLSATLISIFINIDHAKTIIQDVLLKNIPFFNVLSHDLNAVYGKAVTGSLLSRYKKIDKMVGRVYDYAYQIGDKTLLAKATKLRELSTPFTDLDQIYNRLDRMEEQIPAVVDKHKKNIAEFLKTWTDVKFLLGKVPKEQRDKHRKTWAIASDSQVANERVIRENLRDYRSHLFKLKDKFTYSEKDIQYQLNNLLSELTDSEKFRNNVLHDHLKNVIKKYDKTIYKDEYKPELKRLIKEVLKTPELEHNPVKNARSLLYWLDNGKQGIVQEVKNILPYIKTLEYSDFLLKGAYLDPHLFKKMDKTLTKIEDATTRAVKFERLNLPGRLLDLGLGPTALWESLATAIPLALYAKYVFKPTSDEHNKKHQLVKEAPTIVGAVGGTIYGIRKGLYGFEALLFTLIAGIVMRSMGHASNKIYTRFETKKGEHAENKG